MHCDVACATPSCITACGIVPPAVQFRGQLEGQRGAARNGKAFHLRGIGDRHDAGNDGDRDARGARAFHKIPVMAVIEKELRDQEIEPGIHFAFEIVQIDRRIAAFRMLFRISGAADAQTRRRALAE